MLKDRMVELMRELCGKFDGIEKKAIVTQEYRDGYADGCLDMYNEACREYEEIFAEQAG